MRGRIIKNGRWRVFCGLIAWLAIAGAAAWEAESASPGIDAPADTNMNSALSCEAEAVPGVLRLGTESRLVSEVRRRLQRLGFAAGDPDGERFDDRLDAAVREFQASRGLVVDGVVGPVTWAALATDDADDEHVPAAVKAPPPPGEVSIFIDTERLTLTVYSDGKPYKTYPVAVGRPKASTLTPVGEWRVIHKGVNWGGGFGTRWIGLNVPWGIYGIHGTNNPGSIGTRASAGCIRMFNRDVEELYEWVKLGTRVVITGVRRPLSFDRTLEPGAQGPDVVELQLALNAFGFDAGDADGRYGPRTEAAVRKLQRVFGLPEDGRAWSDVYYVLGLKRPEAPDKR